MHVFIKIYEEKRNTAGYTHYRLGGTEEEIIVLIQFLERKLYGAEQIFGDEELAQTLTRGLTEAKNPQPSKPVSFSTSPSINQQQSILRNRRSGQLLDEPPDDNDDWSEPSLYRLSNGKFTSEGREAEG